MRRCVALLVFALAAAPPALAGVPEDVHRAVWAVHLAEEAYARDREALPDLDGAIAVFGRAIDGAGLDREALTVAHYWRAMAYVAVNRSRVERGMAPDEPLARGALADLERVVAGGVDARTWQVGVANAMYLSGSVANSYLGDVERAYRHWNDCARLAHAGCLSIMADARVGGAPGIAADLNESIDLHRRVFATGTAYQCAAAFSAARLAEIAHFGRLRPDGLDALEWLARAYPLLDELAKRSGNADTCSYSRFEVTEYLLRLERGEKREALLRSAGERTKGWNFLAIDYFRGEMSWESFEDLLRGRGEERCHLDFLGWWHASIHKREAQARAHRAHIDKHCELERALTTLRR